MDHGISIKRRLAIIVYEAFLVVALIFATAFLCTLTFYFVPVRHTTRWIQAALTLSLFSYFTWSWSSGRRTLPMKTWKVHLTTTTGTQPTPYHAFLRCFGLVLPWALAEILLTVLNLYAHINPNSTTRIGWTLAAILFPWCWSIFNPHRLPFHDALSRTRLILDK